MKTNEKDLLPVLNKEAGSLQTLASEIVVKDEEGLAQASDYIRKAKDIVKRVEAEKEIFTAPAKEIISAAKAKYDPTIKTAEAVEEILKKAAMPFLIGRMDEQEEEIAKIGARVEKGTLRADTAMRKLDEVGTDAHQVRTENSALRVVMMPDVRLVNLFEIPGDALKLLAESGYIEWTSKARKDVLAGAIVPGTQLIKKPVIQSV